MIISLIKYNMNIVINKVSSGRMSFIYVLPLSQDHHDNGGHNDIGYRQRQQVLPAELHKLIISISRPTCPEPQIGVKEYDHFRDKPEDAGNHIQTTERRNVREGPQPAAP